MLTYTAARQLVIDSVTRSRHRSNAISINIAHALGYVLAQEIIADRDYPPFDRSTRDGHAVQASEAHDGVSLHCVGEIKAGDSITTPLAPHTCIQIMTGAAVPTGADAVVMIEHTQRAGDQVTFTRDARAGQNIVPRGTESIAGRTVLAPGTRMGYAELAIAAQVGAIELRCAAKPRVAILSTGDEVVAIDTQPGPFQIRNSNSVSLAAQVRLAGGEPVLLGNAPDTIEDLGAKIERGLQEDILVLSGGVSMGKYDLVESVLKALGAEFFFDSVAIRPGKPAVFARRQNCSVFGLPGNPVSTMVTFELFVTPAIDILSGASPRPLPLVQAQLAEPMTEKPGLTHFLPAKVEWAANTTTPQVRSLPWQGSGDIATLAHANCFLVIPADRDKLQTGETVSILLRKDVA
jgi:molybdopterin molybdotransferase